MEVGARVTWREGVMRGIGEERFLAGERVLTGTILSIRKSRKGTIFVEMGVEEVVGFAPKEVLGQFWMKRSKLKKGMAWQKSVIRELEQQQRKKRLSQKYKKDGWTKGRQNSQHGPARCFSPDEITAWATQNGYGVSSSVAARVVVP